MGFNIEKISKLGLCSSCGSCVGICPEDCIIMIKSNDGTYYPEVDFDKCNSCNLCTEVCPMINSMNDINKYMFKEQKNYNLLIGNYVNCYKGYSADSKIRFDATSGGLVTSLLLFLLENGLIDGALLTRMNPNNYLEAEPFIARKRSEIISAMGSKYIPVPLNKMLKVVKDENGKFAVVGLPCHIKGIRRMEKYNKDYEDKIKYHFGLFCSHYINCNGVKYIIKKMGIREKDINYIQFRGKGWPGGLQVYLKSGDIRYMKLLGSWFSEILGSFYFCPYSCVFCDDSTSEFSDLSFGDAYLEETKDDKVGTSIVVSRTSRGERLLYNAAQGNKVFLSEININKVIKSQLFPVFFKKRNIVARVNLVRKLRRVFPKKMGELKRKYLKEERYDRIAGIFVFVNIFISRHKLFSIFLSCIPIKVLMKVRSIFKRVVVYKAKEIINSMDKEKKIRIFITNSHSNNRGDEAAQRCMVENLKKSFPQAEIIVATDNPHGLDLKNDAKKIKFFYFSYKKLFVALIWLFFKNMEFNLKSIEKKYILLNYLNEIRESDIVISSPGGPYFGDLYISHEIHHLLHIYFAKKFRKKVMIYAPSMGPFRNKFFNIIRRKILNKVEIITVRDSESFKYLLGLNLSKPLTYLTADSAFNNKTNFKNRFYCGLVNKFKEENKIGEDDLLVGFTPASYEWNYMGFKNNKSGQNNYNKIISAFLDNLIYKYDAKIIFFPQLYGSCSDVPLIDNIISLIKEKQNIIVLNDKYDSYEQQAIISILDFFIGNRYHSLVFALSAGLPVIGISYQFKIRNLMERIGIGEFVIDISNLSNEILLNKFEVLFKNIEQVKITVSENVECIKRKSMLNTIIFESLFRNNNKELIESEIEKYLDK